MNHGKCHLKAIVNGIARKTALKKRRECRKSGELIPLDEDLLEDGFDFQSKLEKQEDEKILLEVLLDAGEPLCSIFVLRYFYKTFDKSDLSEETIEWIESCGKNCDRRMIRGML